MKTNSHETHHGYIVVVCGCLKLQVHHGVDTKLNGADSYVRSWHTYNGRPSPVISQLSNMCYVGDINEKRCV